jgi:hypothetical protein
MSLRIILFSLLSAFLFSACQKAPATKLEDKAPQGTPDKPTNPVSQDPTAPTSTTMNCKTVEVTVSTNKADSKTTTSTNEFVEKSVLNKSNIKLLSATKKSYDLGGLYESTSTDVSTDGSKAQVSKTSYTFVSQVEIEVVNKSQNTVQEDKHEVSTLTGTNGYKFKIGDTLSNTKKIDTTTTGVYFDDGHKTYTVSFIKDGKTIPQDNKVTTYTNNGSTLVEKTELQAPIVLVDDDARKEVIQSRVTDCTSEVVLQPVIPDTP